MAVTPQRRRCAEEPRGGVGLMTLRHVRGAVALVSALVALVAKALREG